MAESSLSLGYADFAKEVGLYLGYGGTSGNWSADQTAEIDRYIQAGIRQFYYPPILPGQSKAHEWSFLTPIYTLATASGDYDTDLPDNYGSMIGRVTFAYPDGDAALPVVGESQIRQLRQTSTSSSLPQYCAVRPKTSDGTTGQRFEMLFWPTPDGIYNLTFKMAVLPGQLTTAKPYPLGGMQHGETVLQSCLAVAEQRGDRVPGPHWQKFMERLTASISRDRLAGPEFLGYNGDRSVGDDAGAALRRTSSLTYNGIAQ